MGLELGGRADKFGNEYERLWLIKQALRMLEDDVVSLLWELPGDEGEGIEFRLVLIDDKSEGHQCKSESGTAGKWTASSLKKVLPKAKKQITDRHVDRFVFVSGHAVPIVKDLATRARHCNNDPATFLANSIPASHRGEFDRLCTLWEIDVDDPSQMLEMLHVLQRIDFTVWDEGRKSVERIASRLAKGRPRAIVTCVGDYLFEHLGNDVHADQLREHLKASGHAPWGLRPDDVAESVRKLQSEFKDSIGAELIRDVLIPREETREIQSLLADADGPRIIFLHGASGSGKSGVLFELTRDRDILTLPIRLDIHRPDTTLDAFSEELGLPAPASDCLAAVASGRPAVLILDQLDAIRWSGGHAAKAWPICKELIERAIDSPNVRVVVACRTFDLDDDKQIARWEKQARDSSLYGLKRVEAKALSKDVVKGVVESDGANYEAMTERERSLLANPQCLYVWCALRESETSDHAYETQSDLLSEFLGRVRRRVTDVMGVGTADYDALIDGLVDYMDRHGRLDAPRSIVAQYHKALDGVQSASVIQRIGQRLRFTHQSYFDHLVAMRVLADAAKGNRTPVEWFRHEGQSLLHRHQARQVLLLLRDQEPASYASTLRSLLDDDRVRFHLKHLALNHLRSIPDPSEDEIAIVLDHLGVEAWRTYVLEEAVARNPAWFDIIDDAGLVDAWLGSGDEALIGEARWLCRIFAQERPERVEVHLAKAWDAGDEGARQFVDWALPLRLDDQSEQMFRWRLERIRSGLHHLEFYEVELLAKNDAARSMRLLEAYLGLAIKGLEETGSTQNRRSVDLEGERFERLEVAGREDGKATWDLLRTVLDRALALQADLDEDQYSRKEAFRPILSILEKVLVASGASLAVPEVIARFEALSHPEAKTSRRIIASMLAGGSVDLADYAIDWLCSSSEHMELRDREERPADDPARALVHRHSPACSGARFEKLEATVLAYHTEWEAETMRGRSDRLERNEYGKSQSVLLSAMPLERLSGNAKSRRQAYEQKFGRVEEYPPDFGSMGGGIVGSPIDKKTESLSDSAWLGIVAKGRFSGAWKQAGPDRIEEASPQTFSHTLQAAAHRDPTRFSELALRIPVDSLPVYFSAIIRGLSETKPPADTKDWTPAIIECVEKVFHHVSPISDVEIARAVCGAVRGRPDEGWSTETRGIIRSLAETVVEPTVIVVSSGTEKAHEELEFTSLNSIHGGIAQAIAALTYSNQDLVGEFLPTIWKLVEDHRPAVRLAGLVAVTPVYNHDKDQAAALFVKACGHEDDRVLAGHATWTLLKYLREPYADDIRPIIERMANSTVDGAAKAGAFWATIQNYTLNRDEDIANSCASGSVSQRKGVVEALVALCDSEEWRHLAHGALAAFFNDTDDEVLSKATDVFRKDKVLADDTVGPVLALAYATSDGFEQLPSGMIECLETWEGAILPYTDAVMKTVERLSGELAENTRDISHRDGMVGQDTTTVLLRLYGEADDNGARELRRQCLDALDALLKGRVGFVKDRLDKLDAG